MTETDLLNHPALEKISPEKRKILTDLIGDSKNLPPEKIMPLMVQTQAKLKALGLAITPEESELMLSVMTRNMSEADKLKYETVKKMVNTKMPKK